MAEVQEIHRSTDIDHRQTNQRCTIHHRKHQVVLSSMSRIDVPLNFFENYDKASLIYLFSVWIAWIVGSAAFCICYRNWTK